MMIIILLISIFSQQSLPATTSPTTSFSIGKRFAGQMVSVDYLQNNPFLKAPDGFQVKSFSISFDYSGVLYEKQMLGNSFQSLLPQLKKLSVGPKIYFDRAVIESADHTSQSLSGYFTIELYTDDKLPAEIYLGKILNQNKVNVQKLTELDSLWHSDRNYQVKEFNLTFECPGSIIDYKFNGNKISENAIKLMRRIPSGKKIYFDNILLEHKTDPTKNLKESAVFITN